MIFSAVPASCCGFSAAFSPQTFHVAREMVKLLLSRSMQGLGQKKVDIIKGASHGSPHAHRRYTQDLLVAKLSAQQRALRLCIEATGDSRDRTKWRKERCRILRQINHRLQDLACHRADILALEITSTDDSHKIFRAVKAMKSIPRPPFLSVQDPEGNLFATDKEKADAICRWFEQRFTDPTVIPLPPFVGHGSTT